MAILFLIFLDQIRPKWIKLDQTGFLTNQKCYYKKLSHFQTGQKWLFYFGFFWIRSVQNGSNLIKLDQIGYPHQSKNVTIKSCHIYRKDKNGCFFFDFFWIRSVQNGSNLIKLDFSLI
jgi:hypothetical protein